jgi:hypothetical protein
MTLNFLTLNAKLAQIARLLLIKQLSDVLYCIFMFDMCAIFSALYGNDLLIQKLAHTFYFQYYICCQNIFSQKSKISGDFPRYLPGSRAV